VFPVPVLFFFNTVSGLGATKKLNMPMFVLLRRFSIVMTLGLEMYMLRKTFKTSVKLAVALMIAGALVAAWDDLSIEFYGVSMILMNDLCTALQGVVLRKKMDENALSSNAIMFYSSVCSIPLASACIFFVADEVTNLTNYPHWDNPYMLFYLFLSAAMGFVINFTYMMCTKYNSPLTTTIVGAFKNIFTSYVGVLFSDFQGSLLVFVGMNTSVVGSLIYNWAEWLKILENEQTRQHSERMKDDDFTGKTSEVALKHSSNSSGTPSKWSSDASIVVAIASSGVHHVAQQRSRSELDSHSDTL
jgi:solute carrier family 35 protein